MHKVRIATGAAAPRSMRARLARIGTALAVLATLVFGMATPAHAGPISGSPISGQYYYIVMQFQVTYCLDVQGASGSPGTPIQIWTCGPQWNQQFQFIHSVIAGKSVWQLRLRYAPSLCVAVDYGGYYAPLVTAPCGPGWDQWFILNTPQVSQGGRIIAPLYEPGLGVDLASVGDGASVIIAAGNWARIWNSVPN
jgi:hypothetical protein